MKIINASEAKELTINGTRKHNDIAKTQTIMKNIRNRAAKGFYYYDYIAFVNYPIAKTLIENGYKLKRRQERHVYKELSLEEFKLKNIYSIRIDWSENGLEQ